MAPDPALPAPKSKHGHAERRDGPQRSKGVEDLREGTPGKVVEEQTPYRRNSLRNRRLKISIGLHARDCTEHDRF